MLLLSLFACRTTDADTGPIWQDTAALEGCEELEWFLDADRDGHGAGDPLLACEAPGELHVALGDDCDDLDPESFPGAPERCDKVDNDCNGVVDDELVEAWYADDDGDGFGAGEPEATCDPPAGFVANADDCNDLDPLAFPGAEEVCNERDDDCDGDTDEEVTSRFYLDEDGDNWGLTDAPIDACVRPDNAAVQRGDCDDANEAVNPAATELCNGLDDDCDGASDEDDAADALTWFRDADGDGYGDEAATTRACAVPSGYVDDDADCDDTDAALNPDTVWYIDYDSDGYGNAGWTTASCLQPNGYVSDDTDCDDTDADTWPGADEYCDGEDDDCDGDVDEDDALDVLTWYADADGDGFGDASVTDQECEQPSGYVDDDSDCDDTDANVYPGARELLNSVDDDCDGDVDDAWWTGTGADGPLTVSADLNLMDSGDIVATGVSAISGADLTVDDATGLAAGDEVLLVNLHGSDSLHAAVGTWEFAEISAVSGATVTLTSTLNQVFGETSNSDLSDQTVVLQRVPQYTDVDLQSGTVSVDAWDGATGGVLAFRATGAVNVASGAGFSVDGAGYWGGETGASYNCDAYQGESYAGEGEGEGDGNCASYNEYWGQYVANYGGGGAHITGGGGNYGGGATAGDSWTGGSATPPAAGDTYGDADLATLFFGSGGGGVWRGTSYPGPGGDGAGILFVAAFEVVAADADAFSAVGASTPYWATGSWTYGAGGGAGGSVWLIGDTLDLASGAVNAEGGLGESSHIRAGGDGGVGRVRLDYNELNGSAWGSATAEEEDACSPDPGYSSAP